MKSFVFVAIVVLVAPSAIADVILFGSVNGVHSLDTANSNVSAIAQTATVDPFGLDIIAGEVFWTEFGGRMIRAADIVTGNSRTVYDQDTVPGMAPFAISGTGNGSFVWSDTHLDGLYSGNASSSSPVLLNTGINQVGEIKGLVVNQLTETAFYHNQGSRARLYKIDLNSLAVTDLTPAANPLAEARGLAADFENDLLFIGVRNNLYEFDLNTSQFRILASQPNENVRDVVFSPGSGKVYYSSTQTRSIFQVDPQSLEVRQFSTGTFNPEGLAILSVPEPVYFVPVGMAMLTISAGYRHRNVR